MPQDRFFHSRAGHSRKVSGLTDLEFRVWWTYEIAADDFGVMRRTALALQAANDALAKRPGRSLVKALDQIIDIGLLEPFAHQGELFVCQLDWQDFQKVRYPRESHLPIPPLTILQKCSSATAALFAQRFRNSSEIDPKDSSRARTREEAEANGKRLGEERESEGKPRIQRPGESIAYEPVPEELQDRAARLVERYGELFCQHRLGAKYRGRPSLDYEEAKTLVPLWSDARLEKLAALVLTTDDAWISRTDRSFKIFAMKASWADDKLRAWETENGVAV